MAAYSQQAIGNSALLQRKVLQLIRQTTTGTAYAAGMSKLTLHYPVLSILQSPSSHACWEAPQEASTHCKVKGSDEKAFAYTICPKTATYRRSAIRDSDFGSESQSHKKPSGCKRLSQKGP